MNESETSVPKLMKAKKHKQKNSHKNPHQQKQPNPHSKTKPTQNSLPHHHQNRKKEYALNKYLLITELAAQIISLTG